MLTFPGFVPLGEKQSVQAACEARRRYLAAHLVPLYANTNPTELWNNIVKYREHSGTDSNDCVETYEELRISYKGYKSMVYNLVFHMTIEEDKAAPASERESRKRLYFSHPFLSPATFLSFPRAEDGTISAVPMYAFAAKRLLLYRLRIKLELTARVVPMVLQDPVSKVAGQLRCPPSASSPLSNGLTQDDIENFLVELVPNLRLVRDIPPWMQPYYLCHASRKFMFMCDTRRTGAIAIDTMMKSDVFSELLRMYESDAQDAITTFPEGCTVDVAASHLVADTGVDDTVAALVISYEGEGNHPDDMYTVKALEEETVLRVRRSQLYWNPGSTEFLTQDVLSMDNWFSLPLMGRIYEHYTSLDLDGDGVLSIDELARYCDSSFTSLVVERVFECHVPHSGKHHVMDYKTYLDFVIATEHAATLPAMKYIWSILDLEGTKSYVTVDTLRGFCKEVASELIANGLMTDISAQSILSEVIDMINPKWHEWVEFDDIVRSGHQATVLPILLSYRNFYAYDCREQTAAEANDEYA
ncbi:uncharacterized protein TEOVI_000696200 [Trypanosoma equiperdum]|uniref:EF-hand domain-containing protein n=4 Tax=Trypanozoon TaxID=39700 RepID=D7SG80_TRYB2|nr:hypothetical protein, conserved [Trypanosoma brucei brucei TREU927]AAQ16065.1 hypothetical protein, conserved [Trypanosoma brucei brucei TREU927]AAX80322.1 hypothetical protein, conserved [Trypanosoma brucei]CAB60088.1 hypothetical protein [Trypanosoma brucei]SCU65392.1 hypothetical protein, conserved [Trypanosoma equiperdum]